MANIESDVAEKVSQWLAWDKNEGTRKEIQDLVSSGNNQELRCRLFSRQEFGTAGIRARMAAGFNCINDLVVIQTAQGILRYLQKQNVDVSSSGIVIGFDGRHSSKRFAALSATVFLSNDVKVYLFSTIVPTPLVSFAVPFLKCCLGIMVTASHNPKDDNGYKVYWSNGAQILAPHDKSICAEIRDVLQPWSSSWDVAIVERHSLYSDPLKVICDAYMADCSSKFCFGKQANAHSKLRFTYTPFHGVGYYYVPVLFEHFGFTPATNLVYVDQQLYPDPEFPTVKFPNPEEGRHVLNLAISTADANSSPLVFATDPDADRFQMAEKQRDGEWRIYSGNEMGALLSWWLLHWWKLTHSDSTQLRDVYMINSTVSSKFIKSLAAAEGFNYEETLTGFKWMANKAATLRAAGKVVLLAWEESIGYMCGSALDKDGVLAAAIFAEFAVHLYDKGLNFADQLEKLYEQYGHHLSFSSYFICRDPAVMAEIFDSIRNAEGPEKYVRRIGHSLVKFVRDLGTGLDSSMPDGKATFPWSSSTLMLTFTLEDNVYLTLRASGTEPKLKYYVEVCSKPGSSVMAAHEKLREVRQGVVQLLNVDKYNLTMPDS